MNSIFNSPILSKYLSEEKIMAYKVDLDAWLKKHNAHKHLGLADHFAIKVENEDALHEATDAIKPFCLDQVGNTPGLTVRFMHGRKITVALLRDPLFIGEDSINCIEIMQPKPEVEGTDVVGFDHFEVLNSDLAEVERDLKDKGADYYVDTTNPFKDIVVAFVNNKKERIKFTNKTLVEVVFMQISDSPEKTKIILS